ncbi:MAG: Spy/CpxP family protein refolding chaperone [Phenylobacterium sp.]|uniref:Spy/CpxP family protein refolding chaperone n=1 Tax=Phenylobacterium sp. TaxID=1871053 RepID=UPI00391CEFFC
MTIRTLGAAVLAGALLAGGAATAVSAQQPARPAPAEREARPQLTPEQRLERRAEHLRAALQLRSDQEPALRAYLQAAKPQRMDRDAMRQQRQAWANMTTPQRLDRQKAMMTERMARFDARAAATKRFYAQLDPQQQKAFDAMAGERRGKRGHGGGWGGGPMGRHG